MSGDGPTCEPAWLAGKCENYMVSSKHLGTMRMVPSVTY